MGLQRLDELTLSGVTLPRISDPCEAHDRFEAWSEEVVRWLNAELPGSGLSAQWASLGESPLVIGGSYHDYPEAWHAFQEVVETRLKWLGALPDLVSDKAQSKSSEGRWRAPADFDRSVFLNCPFDGEFRPLLDAAVYTLAHLGYHIRCALDTADGSRVRIKKLYDLIRSSRLGIHDLSRTELDEVNQLPRFNMPLELGIFLGMKDSGGPEQTRKVALVTCTEPYTYQKYISDVAGNDAVPHHNDPMEFMGLIRDWLATLGDEHVPSASRIRERFRQFRAELPNRCRESRQSESELTYRDYLRHVDDSCSGAADGLILGGDHESKSPTRSDLADAIRSLKGGDDSFAILQKGGSGLTYMQTAGGPEEGFVLEIQEGSTDHQYRCVSPEVNHDDILRAFTLYSEDDPKWRDEFEWERIDLVSRSA